MSGNTQGNALRELEGRAVMTAIIMMVVMIGCVVAGLWLAVYMPPDLAWLPLAFGVAGAFTTFWVLGYRFDRIADQLNGIYAYRKMSRL